MKNKLIWLSLVIFYAACILFPLSCVLLSPKLSDFKDVLFEGVWHTAMLNTFLECICSTTLSVVTGFLFAYAVVKAEIPGKKFFSLVPVIHLVTPPFVGGL